MKSTSNAPKQVDDFDAKLRMWATNRKVYPMPRIKNMPQIQSQKFDSYEEFQAWKDALTDEIIRSGGVEWTK